MGLIGTTDARRLLSAAALLAAGAFGQAGVANAGPQRFDVDGFTNCTGAGVPSDNPTAGTDSSNIVASCCVKFGGVPADTPYGLGCAAPAASQSDENPTIVLPARPLPIADIGDGVDLP
jgi:hypothetical protein